ncbi:MAG: PqqD family protein [Ignavibacteria bacterium]|nr:PqqD family protein [Ignavibacteria bacterium]
MDSSSRGSRSEERGVEEGLFQQRPVRLYDVEERNDAPDCVRIVIPRFRDNLLGRLLTRIAVQTEDKLNLDEFGSFVYMACDGSTSVAGIGEALRNRFGERIEPVNGRLELFIKELFRRNLISFVRDG